MKVYKVKYTTDGTVSAPHKKFQSLMLSLDVDYPMEFSVWKANHFYFAGLPVDEWSPPEMESSYLLRPEPDFWSIEVSAGAFAAGDRAMEIASSFLVIAGQLLPLPYKEKELTICNILECVDCIDEDRSEWHLHPTDGRRLRPKRPFFIPLEMPRSTLFKISQAPMDIFVWERTCEPEDEFKACVEENKLTGLAFEPVWSEEEGIIPYKRI